MWISFYLHENITDNIILKDYLITSSGILYEKTVNSIKQTFPEKKYYLCISNPLYVFNQTPWNFVSWLQYKILRMFFNYELLLFKDLD